MRLTKSLFVPISAIALAVSLGAGQTPQVAPGDKGPATPAAQKSEPTGIAECDKYFTMVDACIATKKMSKEDQQAAEFSVSRLRQMLPIARAPQGRATLVDRCAKSLQLAQKDDKYSCYATKK
jgi:hypothetical protein